MADDPIQRPYRSNELPAHGQPARAPGPGAGGDPLAELARLIGQNDPFSEFGRDGARRPAAPAPEWTPQPAGNGYAPPMMAPDPRLLAAAPHPNDFYGAVHAPAVQPPMPQAQPFGTPNYGRPAYGGAPLAAGADLYQVEHDVPGYPPAHGGGYENDPYNQNTRHLTEEEDELYDDAPTTRRRIGIMAIAGVIALAVIGTAGAFGYRALFGTSASGDPPPVIRADSAPSKIVPATSGKDSNKLITDRVNDRGLGEKIVSREEQPVEIKDRSAGVMFPQGQDGAQSGSAQAALGSGVVGSEPKKVRTIAILPDGSAAADAGPVSAPPVASQARVSTTVAPSRQASASAPPPRVISSPPPASDSEPASRQSVIRVPPPGQQQAARVPPPAPQQDARIPPPVQQQAAAPAPAPASSTAPLSLSPDTAASTAPARAAARPVRTAAAAAPAQIAPASGGNGGAGGYAVQVSSQRSEAEAQAAFRSLQGKYPSQLGSRQPLIHRVDLGAKGIYFRAMVGPFGNSNEAGEVCSSLKAAGADCVVQRN